MTEDEELTIKVSERVVYRVNAVESGMSSRYEFEVTGNLVNTVRIKDYFGNENQVSNFDLRVINEVIKRQGWTLKAEKEVSQ